MATYVVGDLQGCYDPLRRLLDLVDFQPERDHLWAVGDLVNRGPQSLETVRFLRSLGDRLTAVLGNHDLHFLSVATGVRPLRGKDTFEGLLRPTEREEFIEWFRNLPLVHYEERDDSPDGLLMVHAGVPPTWTLEVTLQRAAELSMWLRGPELRRFLEHMYGDKPDTYEQAQTALAKARVTTNALTRIRFCTSTDQLDLKAKGGLESTPAGMQPWFAHPDRALARIPIVFGHWAMLDGQTGDANVYALDTGCVWGKTLTALRLEDRQRFSVSCTSTP